jgi:hypothetical protein
MVALAGLYLLRLDHDPATNFRLYHFVADKDGTANSASLTYVGTFLISVWLVWYLALQEQWTEAVALVGGLGTLYVIGSTARQFTSSRERLNKASIEAEKASGAEP